MDISSTDDHDDVNNGTENNGGNAVDGDDDGRVVSDEDDARRSIDMLRGDDISGRVAAAHRLEHVARVLGEVRTREELLPFLTESVDDDDDVLIAIAAALGKLVPYVGGSAHAHTILPPLEFLLTVEESAVREKASESTKTVANALPASTFREQYAAMVSRLASKEWFTARMSACGLIADGFARLSPERQQTQILQYADLCRDDAPMVRRVASQNLGPLLSNVVKSQGPAAVEADGAVTETLIPLYEELAANDQDSVRLQTTENCIAFGRAVSGLQSQNQNMPPSENAMVLVKRILPLVVATTDDRSWRVRWTAASKFADVVKAFSTLDGAVEVLIPAYEKLLQDPEAEVRTAATFNLSSVAISTPPTAIQLVKRVSTLIEDESEHVRAALAMVATELAPVLGKDATISHLVPPVLLLLRDAASEVRLNLISSLSALNEVIGVDLLSQSLLPAILDLAEDGKWRIRLAIIQHIPLLAKQLGKDFFSDQLSSLCVGWLGDDIASIRTAAAKNLMELTALFGSEWASIHLLPPISSLQNHTSYLRRLTVVQACALMATAMTAEIARTELLPLVLEMASDGVPNIRFNVAKALQTMAPVCGMQCCELQIRPILAELVDDPDRDVRYFANRAIDSLEQQEETSPMTTT